MKIFLYIYIKYVWENKSYIFSCEVSIKRKLSSSCLGNGFLGRINDWYFKILTSKHFKL